MGPDAVGMGFNRVGDAARGDFAARLHAVCGGSVHPRLRLPPGDVQRAEVPL